MRISVSQAPEVWTPPVPPVVPPKLTDEQIVCEKFVKYWLHFLNAVQTDYSSQ